jgi:uncharacterized protein
MPNRLAEETSPYLLQHKDNPVDWYPWGPEAFQKALSEDKPVFLSVGYSSCHWCHVMEHESFEDDEVAQILNEGFVSVKVDREERPDVDEAYMTAVQLSSGRGGWPMTVFMTPDRKPFITGTYFPKEDRDGHSGFVTLLKNIRQAWTTRRRELQKAAEDFAEHVEDALRREPPKGEGKFDEEMLANAVQAQAADFDRQNGGFGAAPKFPPHTSLEFLMAYALRTAAKQDLREAAAAMALLTLEKMCLGGIHDHVGGGIHRYSTDDHWLLPHFEKMLYDNALMLGNLAWGARFGMELDQRLAMLYMRAAERLVNWMQREMTSPEGLLYSALDADSEGEEGKFYIWTEAEINEVLGDRTAAFKAAYNVTPEGNFHDEATGQLTGANILHLNEDDEGRFEQDLQMLEEAREKRVRPGLDAKAIVSWNGLAISALAEAGAISLAEAAAKAILDAEQQHGSLPHQITGGKVSGDGFLDDYACFIWGLIKLAEVIDPEGSVHVDEGSPWLVHGKRLLDQMIERFYDEEDGAFFYSSSSHEELFGRTKPVFDQPVPSGNAVAIRCLVRFGDFHRAARSVSALLGWMEKVPQATEALLLAATELLDANQELPAEVVQPIVAAPSIQANVLVSLSSRELRAGSDGWADGEVVIEIPEGIHINTSDPPARWLTPTSVEVQPLKGEVEYPRGSDYGYEGRTVIPFRVKLPEGKGAEEFEVRVKYQPCTDRECLLPAEKAMEAVVTR